MKSVRITVLAIAFSAVSVVRAEPPAISYLGPQALQPGKPVDVVLYGTNLTGSTSVWTSFPASAELTPGVEGNNTKPDKVSYRLTVPSDAPLGLGAVRVVTPEGVSNLKLLLLDDLPSSVENGTNKTLASAQAITVPTAVEGACEPESSDFYKFSAVAGQVLSIEVYARRLGSPVDPTLRVLAADGRELAFSDDEPLTGVDSQLRYAFKSAGDYYLEVRDVRYQGSANHRYRLRIGDFPLATSPFPLAIQKGTNAKLELARQDGAAAEQQVNVPADVPGNRLDVTLPARAGQSAGWTSVLVSDVPEQLEREPNDAPPQATIVTVPGAIDGRFAAANDRDFYQFEAKQGQKLVFTGQTRSLGSAADLFIRLYNAEGGVIGEVEDSGTEEGSLTATLPADGMYRLRVEDVHHRGGPAANYRILVSPYQAGFSLAAAAEKVDAPQKGVFIVKVTATRRDYNGPITLGIEGVDGCTLRHNIIPEGKPDTTLNVTLPDSLPAGRLAALRIVGTAKIGDTEVRVQASTLGAMRVALAGLPFPPAQLDGSLALGVGPVFPVFFQLTATTLNIPLAKSGATAKLNVQVARTSGFDDKVDLAIEGLPGPATSKPAAIEKGKPDASLEVTSPSAIPPGKHVVRLVGTATYKNQPQKFVFDKVTIEGPPIAVAIAAAGPLNPGKSQKALLSFVGQVAPTAPTAIYQSGVVRGAEGPRAPQWPGFEADNKGTGFSGLDKAPGDDRLTARLPVASDGDYSCAFWLFNSRDLAQPNSPALSGYVFSRAGSPTAANAQPGDHLGIGGLESSPRDKLFFYNGQTLIAGRTTLNLNAWHHVAIVRAGDSLKVHLDGDANPEIQVTAAKTFASNEICLGTRSDGFSPFQGRLDEIAFFDAPLSAEQIQAHFAAAKKAAARDAVLKDGPLAYWKLDEAEGLLAQSSAPARKRLVSLAWKNLPAGLSAPREVLLAAGQDKIEVQLTAAENAPIGKIENRVVAATTPVGTEEFTAESVGAVLEVAKP
jgi:hypothetical protein